MKRNIYRQKEKEKNWWKEKNINRWKEKTFIDKKKKIFIDKKEKTRRKEKPYWTCFTYHNEFYGYRHEHFRFEFRILVDESRYTVQHDYTYDWDQYSDIVGGCNVREEIVVRLKQEIMKKLYTDTSLNLQRSYLHVNALNISSMYPVVGCKEAFFKNH